MKYSRKTARAFVAGGSGETAADADLSRIYPAVVEHLTAGREDDGRARKTSTLTIFAEDGAWKLCLADRNDDTTCWASGETLDAAWKALELALVGGDAEWRRRGGGSRRGK